MSYQDLMLTERIQGLSIQSKAALILGSALWIGTELASGKVMKAPLHSAISASVVALTVYNIECISKPRPCPNWAWVNVAFLALNVLTIFSGRMFMHKLQDEEEENDK